MSQSLPIPASVLDTPGARTMVFAPGGTEGIAVFNIDGDLHAINDSCPHAGASLFSGKLDGGSLRCPAHGLRFDLASGQMAGGTMCIQKYTIVREGADAYIELPD